jgi:membrane-associated phospholipid phosphatase
MQKDIIIPKTFDEHALFYLLASALLFGFLGGLDVFFFDKAAVLVQISEWRTPFLDVFFAWFTHMGEAYAYLVVGCGFIYYRAYWSGFFTALLGLSVSGASWVLKNYFGMPRPKVYFEQILYRPELVSQIEGVDLNTSWTSSFPSGHTMAAFAIYTFLAMHTSNPKLKFVCFLLAIGVGFSRMYLFQHFLSDVWVGAFLGIALGFLAHFFAQKMTAKLVTLN